MTWGFEEWRRNIVRGGGDFAEITDSSYDILLNREDILLDESGRLPPRGRFDRRWLRRLWFEFAAGHGRIAANRSVQLCPFLLEEIAGLGWRVEGEPDLKPTPALIAVWYEEEKNEREPRARHEE